MRSGEEDLVVFLQDMIGIGENEFRDNRADLQLQLVVEIQDIADDQIIAVKTDRVSLIDEPTDVLVMTDQFLKH
jgi:hypothetical protein